jgi:hypothetical protein
VNLPSLRTFRRRVRLLRELPCALRFAGGENTSKDLAYRVVRGASQPASQLASLLPLLTFEVLTLDCNLKHGDGQNIFRMPASADFLSTIGSRGDADGWPEEVAERYERVDVLGKGSFGCVWMARRIQGAAPDGNEVEEDEYGTCTFVGL